VHSLCMITWGEFAKAEPELAAFGAGRLGVPPAYLATVRQNWAPRVHPVTPTITADALFLFMEPTASYEPAEQYVLFELSSARRAATVTAMYPFPPAAAGRPPLEPGVSGHLISDLSILHRAWRALSYVPSARRSARAAISAFPNKAVPSRARSESL